ncbi:MAG: hypothetical protein AAGA77_05775 [Bacteroidota bacterium]
MNFDNIPSALFDLISEKKYEELSKKERKIVHSYFTPEEYDDAFSSLNDFRIENSRLKVEKPGLPLNQKQPALIYRIIHYKIPVYMIASFVMLLFCAYFLISQASTKEEFTQEKGSTVKSNEGIPIHQENYPDDLVFEL